MELPDSGGYEAEYMNVVVFKRGLDKLEAIYKPLTDEQRDLYFDVLERLHEDLYNKAIRYVLDTYKDKMPGKPDDQIFGKMGKMAICQFFSEIYSINDDTKDAITAETKAQALVFFKAFNSYNSMDML